MKNLILLILLLTVLISCKETSKNKVDSKSTERPDLTKTQVIQVAEFKGQQITGVTLTDNGRIFVNFPRWRTGVDNSVLEITADNQKKSYPNASWNSWEIGQPVTEDKFVGVQSVVAFEDNLYVLDTRSQLFENVLDAPRLFVFNLKTNTLINTYILSKNSYHSNSYINDLRVDKKNSKIYLTDSGNSGLIILDIDSGTSRRVLDTHKSTGAEFDYLMFGNKKWNNTVHSDGIALNTETNTLYYHALTAYSLYSLNTEILQIADDKEIERHVTFEGKTAAPDGMIFDQNGNLYFADLENNKIQYRKPDGTIRTLVAGEKIRWADTFSIYDNFLYFTNSRLNEISGDISNMTFTLNKIKLPNN